MAVVKNVGFSKFVRALVQEGDERCRMQGGSALVGVSPAIIEQTLEAGKKEDGLLWAVIAVLLRLRFGSFLFGGNRTDSRLFNLQDATIDDVDFAVMALRQLLQPYRGNLTSLASLFQDSAVLKTEVFEAAKDYGFQDWVAVSIFKSLRANQSVLPKTLGQVPTAEDLLPIIFPLIWEAYGLVNGAFVTGDECVTRVANGKVSGRDYSLARSSCLKTRISGLVLGEVSHNCLTFGFFLGTDTSHEVLQMANKPSFPDLYLGRETHADSEAVIEDQVVPRAQLLVLPPKRGVAETVKPATPEELVATALAAVNTLKGNLKTATDSCGAKKQELATNRLREQEEIARHKQAMEQILGGCHDLESDVSCLEKQIEELRASLLALGITPST